MASEREILQASIEGLHAELEASRAAHSSILEVSARQGEELHASGRALQGALSSIEGAEAEATWERTNRQRIASAAAEFVGNSLNLNPLGEAEADNGIRLILLPEVAFREHVDGAFENGVEKLRSFAYMNQPKDPKLEPSRQGEPLRDALARALRASTDPNAPGLLEELEALAADPVFYKW
jgi:hypothetical protein